MLMIKVDNKKQLAREKSIQSIRDSAVHLFSKHGFSATTMEMIAKHAKVSKGLAYNYFKSKNQIFELIIDEHLSKQEAIYKTISPSQSAQEYLREFFQKAIDFAMQEKKTFILITVCLFQPNSVTLSKKMTESIERRFAPFKEAMRDRFRSLDIKDPDAEMLFVKTFMHGILMNQCTQQGDNFPKMKMVELFLQRYAPK
ncbi:TetR/AcrR family transcriptional regulator [Leptospira idonii]|uniref:TetR/AcrR family transcriptional regulator n=1 Tax=Leptospira idonii TaxID=1193500 RepID=A0A4R9M2A3_9LEPT|nr:TetR/AcrR family transcriptional regulator [Leptospira idonii]TGN20232.1 TetR/AcrR family transcriptional regulator [Leptospira idonii]